ncbi:TPA: heme lyase CcmF/NrfE family subunit [Photobacterium damselae]
MIGELGHFSLILLVVSSTLSSLYCAWTKYLTAKNGFRGEPILSFNWITRVNALLATLALLLLMLLFVQDQFQYHYVATHSNLALPNYFKIAAVWGGHQGSMLFWVFTLSAWSALISWTRHVRSRLIQDVLWVMTIFVAVFGWFTLLSSNPFEFSPVMIEQGRDLNPMLQDIGLIVHPPLLYLGYIGFSTVFAFAFAALLNPNYNEQWAELCLPWAISAWLFLTLGILLGSWWAYNELGWGGWWFWDPVENASLLPWLTSTALLHALVAVRREKQMKLWALSLAIITFCLSVLGTFIVRSGILTSVHAFAVDPDKGISLLLILAIALLVGFVLLLHRSDKIKSVWISSLLSRSYLVLLALGGLSVATLTVLLGTFYPMVYQLLGFGQISVGAPYFNTLFAPLALLMLILLGMVPFIKWQGGTQLSWVRISVLCVVAMSAGVALYWYQVDSMYSEVAAFWGLGAWVVVGHCVAFVRSKRCSFMLLAHVGITIGCVGAMMNAHHSYEVNHKMSPGTLVQMSGWQIEYQDTNWYVGSNYTAQQAALMFRRGGQSFQLFPERRHYPVRVMNMSEPAIRSVWNGDFYVTLGPVITSGAYAMKIQFRAYIGWIWLGGCLVIAGAIRRLSVRRRVEDRLRVIKQA